MTKKIEVVRGKIENLKRVPTRTENSMVTFTVGGTPCKAFGKGAEMMTRWMQHDPNSVGQFEGYFDRRSERFGREFVAAHGKLIETERIDIAERAVMAAPGARLSHAALMPTTSTSSPSAPTEPIPANEPIKHKTDLDANASSNPLPCMPQVSASLPVVDSAPVKQVTFEDLENEYKLQKMKRQMDFPSQPAQHQGDLSDFQLSADSMPRIKADDELQEVIPVVR